MYLQPISNLQDVVKGVRAGAPLWMWSRHAGIRDLMPHPCLHWSVVSLQFAHYRSSLSSNSGFRDQPLSRKLLRLPVKEPLLTGLEHSSLLTCGLKGHSCSDTLPSLFARFQTGPTSDPSAVNIFTPLMWHVCCVVTQCWSTLMLLVRGETLIKNIGRYDHNESSSSNGIPQN